MEEILKRIESNHKNNIAHKTKVLAQKYNSAVIAAAKACRQTPGAGEILCRLAKKKRLYVSSTTPYNSLKEINKYRNWDKYFCGVYGYPHNKAETLLKIIRKQKIRATELLVVGDGETDRVCTAKVSCNFFHINTPYHLKNC